MKIYVPIGFEEEWVLVEIGENAETEGHIMLGEKVERKKRVCKLYTQQKRERVCYLSRGL
jgi:hypothetical protein